jgi:hypothetical protein
MLCVGDLACTPHPPHPHCRVLCSTGLYCCIVSFCVSLLLCNRCAAAAPLPSSSCASQNEKGNPVHKVVFIIFYRSASLTHKLRRICDAFAANRHDIPEFESKDKVRLAV